MPDNFVGVALLERLCRSDVYGELPREKCSWAYRSTPISLFPASIAMFSAVLPSYNKKILCAKHTPNHTITQTDTRCKGALLIYVFIVFYFVNNTLSWQLLYRRFKCSGDVMGVSLAGWFPVFCRIMVPSSSESSNNKVCSHVYLRHTLHSSFRTAWTWLWRYHDSSKCQEPNPRHQVPRPRRLESLVTLMTTSNLAMLTCFTSLQKYTTVYV